MKRGAILITALWCTAGAGCAADPELARYIDNRRVIGNYTETDLGHAAREIGAGAAGAGAIAGVVIGWWWLEQQGGDCR